MTSPQLSSARGPGRSLRRPLALTAMMLCGLPLVGSACSDDDDITIPTGGSGGRGGAGSAGRGGTAGSAGSAGTAGTGGAAGSAGTGGSAGAGAGSGPTGTISVLNDDATALRFPTTAAVRGTDLFVVNGQLDQLGGTPVLPFNVVSLPLVGGPISSTSITLPGDDFFPEGIAADAQGNLYVGSVTDGTIIRVPAGSTTPDADPFVEGVAERGVIGLTVDTGRDRLWFCDSSPNSPTGGDLVGVNLDTGEEEVRHAMPNRDDGVGDAGAPDAGDAGDAGAPTAASTFCNDVIVAPNGNVFATDSSGRVFRVLAAEVDTPNSAAVWLDDPAITVPGGFGANGLDLVGTTLIIASNGLVAVDSTSNTPASTVRTITLREGNAAATLCGPDGLETVPNSTTDIVVVENGSCATGRERVVKVTLDLD